ncbi:MAG: tetratricopeptide repeat protein [Acidobacteria bacterium]|nr:tetratricopeptide repeat protein [Acidobacteriota bacterium]MCI0720413.1 tetratricopeptide repeat protein [Acidobacteriota bacterium]
MALNKAKVLKSADKYVIQGKISHAIIEYQKLIKEDPTDLPLVNTLGDLYVRIGNIPEAVKCFTRLAESYDNGGFVVRAIAMYKKVSKIDPGQIQSLSRLADLYLRQGLNSDARAHYLQVADYLIRKGELENAVTIYQRVIQIDPENPAVDGRIAEAFQRLGKKESAVSTYLSAGIKSRRKGALDEAAGYLKRALDLDENEIQTLLTYSEVLSDQGKTSEALASLSRIPLHDFKPEVLETSFSIHLKAGNASEAEKIAHQLLELDSQYFKLLLAVANADIAKGDLDRAVLQAGRVAELAVKHGEGKLVEAQLKSILQNTTEHIPAILELVKFYTLTNERQYVAGLLEKAGAIYIRREQLGEAAGVYLQLVQLEPNDPVHRENLRQVQERLGLSGQEIPLPKLVPDMSVLAERFISEPTLKTISPDETAEGGHEPGVHAGDQETVKGFIVEGDLFAGYGLCQKALDQYQRVIDAIPHHIEAHEKIRDMHAKNGELPKAAQECLILANIYTARGDSEHANRNFALAYQYDPHLHQEPIYPAGAPPSAESHPLPVIAEHGSSSQETAAVPAKKLEELLQEADFYLDLGFLSEAKASMDQYRQVGPPNAEFQQRVERYENLLKSQGGRAPELETTAVASSAPEASEEINIAEFESTGVASADEVAGAVEITRADGFESTSVADDAPASADAPAPADATSLTGSPPRPALPESFDEMMIDLDEELVESTLEKTAAPLSPSPAALAPAVSPAEPPAVGALSDVFEEFKEGMEDDGDGGDYETHYNLGIAFKEMGLMEEAIGEFQKALKGVGPDAASEEFVRCCNMLGLCFVDRGLPQVAVKWFTRGLSSPGRNEETYQALRYDLGCAHQMAGNEKAALETFLDVYGVNINYRDVSEKIESLKNRIHG